MKNLFGKKMVWMMILIFIIFAFLVGCSDLNKPGVKITENLAPAEEKPDKISDNNRTNFNNGGMFAEDEENIYYINVLDGKALYKLDKKTLEKQKIADASGNIIKIAQVADGKIYYLTGETGIDNLIGRLERIMQVDAPNPFSLYCVSKDGSAKTTLISKIHDSVCVVKNGYAYYLTIIEDPKSGKNICYFKKSNLDSGKIETIKTLDIDETISDINIAGDKMYYHNIAKTGEKQFTHSMVIQYDIRKNDYKVLLTTEKQESITQAAVSFLEYYNGFLYYADDHFVSKYDIGNNKIENISTIPTGTGRINSLTVSQLGVFFTSRTPTLCTLYNAETLNPIKITDFPADGSSYLSLSGDNIFITYDKKGIKGNFSFIKGYDLKGNEVNLGF